MTPGEWLLDEVRAWVGRAETGAPYEPDAGEAAQGRALAERVRTAIVGLLPEAARPA